MYKTIIVKIFFCVLIFILSFSGLCVAQESPKKESAKTSVLLLDNAFSGTVEAKQRASLSLSQSGLLTQVPEEGQAVKKGDIVAQLDKEQLSLNLLQSETVLEGAKLNLQIEEHNQEKTKRLCDEKIIAPIAVIEGEFKIKKIKNDLKIAETQLQSAQLALNKSSLTAPFDGIIVNVAVNVGEQISSGQKVAELVNLKDLTLTIDIPESLTKSLKPGTTTDIRENDEKVGTATVKTILPLIDPTSGMQKVIWDVNPEKDSLTGHFVTLSSWESKE